VLELLLYLAIGVAAWRALRARHRVALPCGALLVYLLLADLLAAWAVSKPHQVMDLFAYLFLGPLAMVDRQRAALFLPSFALEHPIATRVARITLGSIASWRCLHESAQLNPLLPRAYVLDDIAMPFAAAAVVDTIEGVLLLWAFALASHGG
jgi:hypothetical protein